MRAYRYSTPRRVRRLRGLPLVDPMWRKSPLLLFRYPGLLAPLLLGSLLLALTAAAYPLFIGASASSLLGDEIASPVITPFGAGLSYGSSRLPIRPVRGEASLYEARQTAFSERVSRSAHLGPVLTQVLGPEVSVDSEARPSETIAARLFGGTAALAHVQRIRGHVGSGAWLPDLVADALGTGPGDTVTVSYGTRRIELAVAGVYASLYAQPPRGYWRQWDSEIYPYCPPGRDCAPAPPQFIVLGRHEALSALRQLRVPTADFEWVAPVMDGAALSRDKAYGLARFVEKVRRDATDPSGRLGQTLKCCTEPNMYGSAAGPQTKLRSEIGPVLERVETRLVTVEAPARLVQVVGALVALAVMGGAGAFMSSARTTEMRLLLAQGRSALTIGAKVAIEGVVPSIIGGAAGVALAFLVVGAIVQGGSVGEQATADSVGAAAGAVGLSIALGAAVAGVMSRSRHGPTRGRSSILRSLPWEALLLVLAYLLFRDARGHLRLAAATGFEPAPPPASLFLFPIATIGGVAIAGARVFRAAARRFRARSENLRPPSYLAVHRLADARGLALLLFAASGLAIGIFVHGQTVARSLADSVDAKAGLFVGSDVQALVTPDTVIPPRFPLPATKVTRIRDAGRIVPGGEAFDLIAVDPQTFAGAAAWREGFADAPLSVLMGGIAATAEGPLRLVVVGADVPAVEDVEIEGSHLSVETVGTAKAFPGMLSRRLTLVVDFRSLEGSGAGTVTEDPEATTELWLRGEADAARAALGRLELAPYGLLTVEQVKDIPYIAAVVDMFGILDAVGLAAAVLVLAALALYLQARGRSQLVAHGLSTRMGMGREMHRRSLALETGSVLTFSSALGAAVALAVALVIIPQLDPIATVAPDPLLVIPWWAMAFGIVGIGLASWGAAWLTEIRARRAILGEDLRVDW